MHAKQPLPYTVLIVEDELAIAENLMLALQADGFIVDIAREAKSALLALEQENYDLVLLDIGLPGADGLSVLRQIRAQHQLAVPVLVISARAALEDKLRGFSAGVDDYLAKPFALAEVVMRARALTRRSKQLSDTAFTLDFGPLHYVLAKQQVSVHGKAIKLARQSLMTLELLMRHGGRVVSRQRLEDYLWQGEPPSHDAARGQLHLLRKALAAHGYTGIETVHGMGWRLSK